MQLVITGGSSGLGEAIIKALPPYFQVENWSLENSMDITKTRDLEDATNTLSEVDILVNCAGINTLSAIANIDKEIWNRSITVNAEAILRVTQALLPKLRGGTICNILSNAAWTPMTSSLAYAASKGAALSMTRVMARELIKSHDITVFGIAPNRLSGTAMSTSVDRQVQRLRGWTAEEVRDRQAAALPAGVETPVKVLAEFIAFLLSSKERHRYLHGCIIPYGGP